MAIPAGGVGLLYNLLLSTLALAIGRSGDNSAIRKSDEDNSICSSRYTFMKIGPAPAIGGFFLSGGAESARSGKAKLTFWGGFL